MPGPATITGSLAIWARSSVFNTKLNVYDTLDALTGSDDSSGYNLAGDIDNAAVNVQTIHPGAYNIQLSSSNGSYAAGTYEMFISPGNDLKLQYIGSSPISVVGISSSNYVAVCDDGNQVVFYNIDTNTIDKWYNNLTGSQFGQTVGACYSKAQDRVFVVGYDNNLSHDAVFEFDNTGSLLNSYSTAPFIGNPIMCYDQVNDRVFIMRRGQTSGFAAAKFAVFDCASRTMVGGVAYDINPTPGITEYCTYSDINNRYYISFHNSTNNVAMTWVDASNFANSGSTSTQGHDFIQYISGSNVIAVSRNNLGGNEYRGFVLFDPVTDTIVYTSTALWYFEAGASFDTCQNMNVLAIDNGGGPTNANGLLVLDTNFNVSNFIAIQNTGNGEYVNGAGFVLNGSRFYTATNDYDGINRLYSCKISCNTGSVPYP